MLLDSNIVIYASQRQYDWLRRFVARHAPFVSAVSMIETLGYHRLSEKERTYLEEFFAASEVLPVSHAVVQEAIRLRQERRMTLGDALIAATALVWNLELVTRNTPDFDWVDGLRLFNPFEGKEADPD